MHLGKSGIFQCIEQYYLPLDVLHKAKEQVGLILFSFVRRMLGNKIFDNTDGTQMLFIPFIAIIRQK